MSIQLDVQIVSNSLDIPKASEFKNWADLVPIDYETSICLRIVDEHEAKTLNKKYRKINKATNVLSFPAEIPSHLQIDFLGDIVICAPIVTLEAQEYNKDLNNHWAHLFIHGILHLQGYDHEKEIDAEKMESLEIKILHSLGISNPYEAT